MSENLLSNDEVKRLTGYDRPGLQAQYCQQRGIRHYINAKGEVIVPSVALLRPLSAQSLGSNEPDFGQFADAEKKSA